ncbi:MAG: transposase [Nanoarchaeota archaeon]|nr:transposase [Nanoarchaeota archaeon]MCG2717333.1 transposase [Nanoarchaeota archaeon]
MMEKVVITHKFRLYPSKQQEAKLMETLELCRQTYNILLNELNSQKVIDKSQIQGIIPNMKICDSSFKKLYSKTMQYECYRLFSNLSSLAKSKNKRKVGRLRFKGKGWFKTFTYNQSGFKLIVTGKRYQTLHLSKIGSIPIRCHRKIKGKIKQITIKKEASGKWHASIIEETKKIIKKQQIRKAVGIDLGLTDIIYDSEGNKITNPRHLKKHCEKLSSLQRKVSRKKKGSRNRKRMRIKLTRQYEKLVNTRNDFLHKTSKYYVDNYDAIGIEDMTITSMVNGHLAKHILDASWGKFRQMIAYKAERAGKLYIPVNHKGTTQRCSQCGEEIAKDLSERVHKCHFCGFKAPRDYNSALEIKKLTLKRIFEIGQELSESTLVEMEALPTQLATTVNETRSYSLN